MRRFQLVWWWWPWGLWFGHDEGSMARLFRWRFRIGPLEIRRWTDDAAAWRAAGGTAR